MKREGREIKPRDTKLVLWMIVMIICILVEAIYVGLGLIQHFFPQDSAIAVSQIIERGEEEQIPEDSGSGNHFDQAAEKSSPEQDSYWGIILPVMIAYLVTILGSMLTVYIFLKQALDRTADNRQYYGKVVGRYREKNVKRLMYYCIVSFVVMSLFTLTFLMEWGSVDYFPMCIKVFWCVTVLASCFMAGGFLFACINSERGLNKEAERLKIQQEKEMESFLDDAVFRVSQVRQAVEEKLGLNEEDISSLSQFIYQFAKWEEMFALMVGMGDERKLTGNDTLESRIEISLEYADKLFNDAELDKLELDDAKANGWEDSHSLQRVVGERSRLRGMDAGRTNELYRRLADYRDTLKVYEETGKKDEKSLEKEEDRKKGEIIYQALLCFARALTTTYFRAIPKIEMFYPSAYFKTVDFYNVRFENSSFRASRFEDVVMSRTRAVNTNFNLSSLYNVFRLFKGYL